MKTALTVTGALLVALAVARPLAQQPPARLALEVQDYATLPITADNTSTNTRAQLARVNFMREEPGGRRFFVNDLNGPLYILDKQKKTFTTYLDFKAGMTISIIEEQKGKAAAGPDRCPVGQRLERRRHLRRNQARPSTHDDGRIRRTHSR